MPSCLGLFGSSSVPQLGKYARSGRNLIVAVPSSNSFSFWQAASPPVLSNDLASVDAKTTPGGYTVTVGADGIAVVQTTDPTRQSVHVDFYSRRKRRWLRNSTQYINNQGPVPVPLTQTLTVGAPMAPVNLALSAFTDAESDPLVIEFLNGTVPVGTQINAAGIWSGTPTVISSGGFTVQATDIADASSIVLVSWSVVSEVNRQIAGSLTAEQARLKSLVGGALTGP